jgi:hypothetical protein
VLWGALIVVVLIVIFRDQFSWLADLVIDPGSKVPDPSEIDIPGVK